MNAIETLVAQLTEALREQHRTHTAIIDTATVLSDAIKRSDLDAVATHTARYDILAGQIEQLEERRLAVCDELTEALGYRKRHLNLATLIGMLPMQHRPALLELRGLIREAIRALTRLNTSNRVLLEASLLAVGKGMRLRIEAQQRIDGYGRSGRKTSKPISQSTVKFTA